MKKTASIFVSVFLISGIFCIQASAQSDVLEGNTSGTIIGTTGEDVIQGSPGQDNMQGLEGKDIFVIIPGQGPDNIMDFEPGTDKIKIKGVTFDQLEFSFADGKTFVKIAATGEELATVNGDVREDSHFITE